MSTLLRMLILEDQPSDLELILYELRQAGFEPHYQNVATEAAYLAHLHADLDVILADYSMPQFDALRALELLQERGLEIPFIVVTGSISEEAAVECMKRGAADYLIKDRLTRLGPAVTQALQARHVRDEKRLAEDQVRRRHRELTLLNRIIAASATGLDDRAVLQTACQELALALDIPRAIGVLFNKDRTMLTIVAEHLSGTGLSILDKQISFSAESPLASLADERAPLMIDDASNDPRLEPARVLAHQGGVASLLFLPLIVDDEVIGGLGLGAVEQQRFSEDDLTLAKSVADQLSGALSRARSEAERRRLSTAIEQTADCVIITDTAGTIVYVNPAFEHITGYSRTEVIGRNPRLLKSGRHDAAFYADLWSSLQAGKNWRGRFVNRKKDGTLYTADTSISPARDESGRIVSYVDVQRDITHELELEQRYLQAQKMEAIGRLAGGVAHDFNNLLTAITGYTEMSMTMLDQGDPLWENLSEVLKAASRAAALTNQLLIFSRKQVLQPEVLDLNALLRNLEKMLYRLIGEDIELQTVLDPQLGMIKADAGQIEQVVMNLAVNARDAMPQGGRLALETANIILNDGDCRRHNAGEGGSLHPGAYVRLTVSDTGIGMDEYIRSHAFEPFFTTKEAGKGTGLGLATVHGIIKQSGGDIQLHSEPGRGTQFEIYLPQTQEAREGEQTQAPPASPRGVETILVVEDEESVRELACRILERQGYTVLSARHPEEALRLATQHGAPIHLLLTDVVMPGMGGHELANRILTSHPHTRVLYISGYTDSAILRHGILVRDVAFLQKPFTPRSLASRVREVLNAPLDKNRQ